MIFIDVVIDEEFYENMNRTIPDGNVMNVSLIIIEGKYDAIDAGDFLCHGYYIINFSSSPCTLLFDLSIEG